MKSFRSLNRFVGLFGIFYTVMGRRQVNRFDNTLAYNTKAGDPMNRIYNHRTWTFFVFNRSVRRKIGASTMRNLINDSNTTQRKNKRWQDHKTAVADAVLISDAADVKAVASQIDYFVRNLFYFSFGLSSTDTEHVYVKILMKKRNSQ